MSLEDPERAARQMACEAEGRTLRLAGSGELLPEHKGLVEYLEKHRATWWGFTRRVDTHRQMPRLMFSLDASTPPGILAYVEENAPVKRRTYVYRPGDPPAELEVAVTFPVHGPRTNYVALSERLESDCPGVESPHAY